MRYHHGFPLPLRGNKFTHCVMKGILVWLMIAGIVAGMFGRMIPHVASHLDFCERSDPCSMNHGHSCEKGTATGEDCCPVTSSHDHDSSPHLHVCCAPAPIIAETDGWVRVGLLMETRASVLVEQWTEPESPVFKLDKPPLI